MVESPPPDDPLEAHFSGKRQWDRVTSAATVGLRGEGGTYEARVLDLSRGGILAAIEDPTFYEGAAPDGLALAGERFPDGPEVRFPGEVLVRRAEIVRITPHGDGGIALGCRFEPPLTGAEAVRIGVAAAEADHPEATAALLSHVPRPRRPISIVLFGEGAPVGGPYALGRVLAVGERAVDVSLDGSKDAVLADLADGTIHAALVRGTERLWEGDLRVVACEEDRGGMGRVSLRMRLVATSAWGRPVAKHMRRARGT